MASNRWLGRAQAIAQVDTVTMSGAGNWVTGDTITLTINQKSLVVTVGASVTDADVAITVKEAWEDEDFTDTTASKTPADGGQDIVEFAQITATVSGDVVTLTRDTPGDPFVLTVTESVSGDETATEATATAATGPNFYDNADNWTLAAAPIATNDVFVDDSSISILHGLGQSGVALASFTVARNYTGTIGLPKQNVGGYVEYRADYLAIDATTISIGNGEGSGSSQIKIDSGSTQTAITIESTGSPPFGLEAFIWKGTHVNSTLEVIEGTVGTAVFGGEVAQFLTLLNTAGTVRLSQRTTVTNVTNESGDVSLNGTFLPSAAVRNSSGTILISGLSNLDALTIDGGTVDWRSTGTITTANIGGAQRGASLDFSNDNSARIITNCNLNLNGRIIDPLQTVTYTNGILLGSGVELVSAA